MVREGDDEIFGCPDGRCIPSRVIDLDSFDSDSFIKNKNVIDKIHKHYYPIIIYSKYFRPRTLVGLNDDGSELSLIDKKIVEQHKIPINYNNPSNIRDLDQSRSIGYPCTITICHIYKNIKAPFKFIAMDRLQERLGAPILIGCDIQDYIIREKGDYSTKDALSTPPRISAIKSGLKAKNPSVKLVLTAFEQFGNYDDVSEIFNISPKRIEQIIKQKFTDKIETINYIESSLKKLNPEMFNIAKEKLDNFYLEKTKKKIKKAGVKIKTGISTSKEYAKEKISQGKKYLEKQVKRRISITNNYFKKKISYKDINLNADEFNDYLTSAIEDLKNKIPNWNEISLNKLPTRYIISLKKLKKKVGKHAIPIFFKGSISAVHRLASPSSTGPFDLVFDITWSRKYNADGKILMKEVINVFDSTLFFFSVNTLELDYSIYLARAPPHNKLSLIDLQYKDFFERIAMSGDMREFLDMIYSTGENKLAIFGDSIPYDDAHVRLISNILRNKEFDIEEIRRKAINVITLDNVRKDRLNLNEIFQLFNRRCYNSSIRFHHCFWKAFIFDPEEEIAIHDSLISLKNLNRELDFPENHIYKDLQYLVDSRMVINYKADGIFRMILRIECPCKKNYNLYEITMSEIIQNVLRDHEIRLPCQNNICNNVFILDESFTTISITNRANEKNFTNHRIIKYNFP